MKKEDIITLPNAHLRQKSQKITTVDDHINELVKDMTSAALDWEDSRPHEISAALAAVQIDRLERVVIVRGDFEKKENREFIPLINPEIVKFEGDLVEDYEGCLSVKDIYGKVPRYTKIRVRALDINGKQIRMKVEGFLARVIQHEIDHTNGVVFVDHIKDKKDAFYRLDDNGELQHIDFDTEVANRNLFDD